MKNDPRSHFHDELLTGMKLCVMPVPRLLLHSFIPYLDGCILYPAGELDLKELRIVSYPEWEWQELERKGYGDLEWSKTASTRISYEDYEKVALIAFPIELDFGELLGGTHEDHKALLLKVSERAGQAMDLIRLNYCRMDLPNTLPGLPGSFENDIPYTSALFYNIADHESYIIVAEIMTHKITTGLGLELDDYHGEPSVGGGETGNIARHALRMMSTAMEANSPTAKFVQCMTILEFLAFPDRFEGMQKVKGQIAAHVARDKKSYHQVCETIRSLSDKKDDSGKQIGLRTCIIHNGSRLEQLRPSKQKQEQLFRQLQSYIGATIQSLIAQSDQSWETVLQFREERRRQFGIS